MAGLEFAWEIQNFRGHRDVSINVGAFNPPISIQPGTLVWASATEIDASGQLPQTSGAFITVMQVTPVVNFSNPGQSSIVAHVLVDNVPVNINVRVTFFVATGL